MAFAIVENRDGTGEAKSVDIAAVRRVAYLLSRAASSQPSRAVLGKLADELGIAIRGITAKATAETARQKAALGELEPIPAEQHGVLAKQLEWFLGDQDPDTVDELWHFRTGTDRAIRRVRLVDVAGLLRTEWWAKRLITHTTLWDQVSVTNMLLAVYIQGVGWMDWWEKTGAFGGSVERWTQTAKIVNNMAKAQGFSDVDDLAVAECVGYVGYRNPPYEGFDLVSEAEGLAHSGIRHDRFGGLARFSEIAQRILRRRGEVELTADATSFDEYLKYGPWETSGSSNVGRVVWKFKQEAGHFKARKNFLPDVLGFNEAVHTMSNLGTQDNTVIIKPERGKIRIAVASDVWNYWAMAWLDEYLSNGTRLWNGTIIDEGRLGMAHRLYRMGVDGATKWHMPYDYASFDHQVTTEEIMVLVDILVELAHDACPSITVRDEIVRIGRLVVSGFQHSKLRVGAAIVRTAGGEIPTHVKPGDDAYCWNVEGGLMSGIRWTSKIGDMWNLVMMQWAAELVEEISKRKPDSITVKGDDSEVEATSPTTCLLMKAALDAIGAKGGDGKFGIHYGQSEFLRVWFRDGKANGFLNRAIPAITQRKPWSSEPWTYEQNTEGVRLALDTCKRRGADTRKLDSLWDHLKRGWAERRGAQVAVLGVPKALGGPGIGDWDGHTVTIGDKQVLDPPRVEVVSESDWRMERIAHQADRLGLRPNTDELAQLARDAASEKILADDVPAVLSRIRHLLTPDYRCTKRELSLNWPARTWSLFTELTLTLGSFDTVRRLEAFSHRPVSMGYGKLASDVSSLQIAAKLARLRNTTMDAELPTWLKRKIGLLMAPIAGSGMTRRQQMEWLQGSIQLGQTGDLHPEYVWVIQRAVAITVAQLLRGKRLTKELWVSAVHTLTSGYVWAATKSLIYKSCYVW
jgi:hypothetical protein